jgi:hypothetical protein
MFLASWINQTGIALKLQNYGIKIAAKFFILTADKITKECVYYGLT